MERMPIYYRLIFNKYIHADPLCYRVLVRLSTGYPLVVGRLHTRYSPVRRSPPVYCYTVLPLDLHVLGLSLAFILSQDQTLRCILFFCFLELAVPGDHSLLKKPYFLNESIHLNSAPSCHDFYLSSCSVVPSFILNGYQSLLYLPIQALYTALS